VVEDPEEFTTIEQIKTTDRKAAATKWRAYYDRVKDRDPEFEKIPHYTTLHFNLQSNWQEGTVATYQVNMFSSHIQYGLRAENNENPLLSAIYTLS
jgi:hypothetical protein